MKNLLPTTIEGWAGKKRQFMRLANFENNDEQRQVYCNAVDYCDRKIGQILARRRELLRRIFIMVVVVNVLTLISIFLCGCGTLTGFQSDIHQITRPTTLERVQ